MKGIDLFGFVDSVHSASTMWVRPFYIVTR